MFDSNNFMVEFLSIEDAIVFVICIKHLRQTTGVDNSIQAVTLVTISLDSNQQLIEIKNIVERYSV